AQCKLIQDCRARMGVFFECIVTDSFSFFFQAEDGIRDFHVTGVQTCALPISFFVTVMPAPSLTVHQTPSPVHQRSPVCANASMRSEERRVGKECRCGWSANH